MHSFFVVLPLIMSNLKDIYIKWDSLEPHSDFTKYNRISVDYRYCCSINWMHLHSLSLKSQAFLSGNLFKGEKKWRKKKKKDNLDNTHPQSSKKLWIYQYPLDLNTHTGVSHWKLHGIFKHKHTGDKHYLALKYLIIFYADKNQC